MNEKKKFPWTSSSLVSDTQRSGFPSFNSWNVWKMAVFFMHTSVRSVRCLHFAELGMVLQCVQHLNSGKLLVACAQLPDVHASPGAFQWNRDDQIIAVTMSSRAHELAVMRSSQQTSTDPVLPFLEAQQLLRSFLTFKVPALR